MSAAGSKISRNVNWIVDKFGTLIGYRRGHQDDVYLPSLVTDANGNTALAGPNGRINLIDRLQNDTYMVVGDSKSDQGVAGGASGFWVYARGYWGKAINLSGVPLKLKSVCATGGWKVSDMLTGYKSHIALYGNPGLVLFYGGVNDLYVTGSTATSIDTLKSQMLEIYGEFIKSGAKVIRIGIPPEGTSAGAFYTKTLINTVQRFNAWDEAYCRSQGWGFVDPWRGDIHGQPMDASGYAKAANYYDTLVHESHTGAYALAKAVATEIVKTTGITSPKNYLASSNVDAVVASKLTITSITGNGTTATATLAGHPFIVGDDLVIWSSSNTSENAKDYYGVKRITARDANTFSYACTDSSATTGTLFASTGRNHIENSMQTGITGTKTVVTGDVSDGFVATATAGMTVAATKENHTRWSSAPGSVAVADEDGEGFWQKFAITSAAANDQVLYRYQTPDPLAIRGGENYVAECEIEVYGTIANLRAISLYQQIYSTATGSGPVGITLYDAWDTTSNENGTTEPHKLVLRTPVWNPYIRAYTTIARDTLYPAGTFGWNSATWPEFNIIAEFSGAGGCNLRIGKPRLVRVD